MCVKLVPVQQPACPPSRPPPGAQPSAVGAASVTRESQQENVPEACQPVSHETLPKFKIKLYKLTTGNTFY